MLSSHSNLRYSCKVNACICPRICIKVHSNFNSPQVEATNVHQQKKMDKPVVVYPYNVIHISNEKELIHCSNLGGLKKNHANRKKTEYTCYDSIYIKPWKMQTHL